MMDTLSAGHFRHDPRGIMQCVSDPLQAEPGYKEGYKVVKFHVMLCGKGSNHGLLGRILLIVSIFALTQAANGQDSTTLTTPLSGVLTSPSSQSSSDPYGSSSDSNNYPGSDSTGMQRTGQGQSGSSTNGSDLQNRSYDSTGRVRADQEEYRNPAFRILPPDPPTEFQKMVLSSTGKLLPIYGAQLFRNAPSTFAPLDRVPVTPEYVIGPGDELLVQIWGQVTLNSHFTVDRAGNIYIPHVGTMRVAGVAFGQLREFLQAQVGRVFHNFDLNVNIGQLRSIQVFVVGQARRPGSYTISSLSTLVDALFVTGGPTPQGSMRHVQLKRAGKVLVDFDLYSLLQRGDKTDDVPLLTGDVIYIPPIGPQVALAGAVNTPALYELKSDSTSTVGDALSLSGGPSTVASVTTVRLERIDNRRMRSVTDLKLDDEGRAATLRDGDILELVAIIDQYKNGVTLRGNVANPGHYAFHPGMHVSELFPEKDALTTRDYWLRRGQLGKPVLTYVPVCPPIRSRDRGVPLTPTDGSSSTNNSSNNRSQNDLDLRQQSTQPNEAPEDSTFDGCVQLPEPGANENIATTVRTTNSSSLGQNGQTQNSNNLQDQNQRNVLTTPPGSSAAALADRSPGQFPVVNDVKLSAPDIDWSYAVIERRNKETLTTALFPFNLGHLVLDHDNSQDLALEAGDVVTIFSKADLRVPQAQQTRLVHLEGEFQSSGVYSVLPGETLKDLVKRAGGFTSDAYLFGSEFTRESTRRVQQQRLTEYVNQIALQASTNSANSANRTISAVDSAASAAAAQQSQNVVLNLRQMRASGRIVLDLKPNANAIDQIPPIPLEDGDRFIIPQMPSTVSVTGAVYNPNAFIFDKQRRLRDYLRLAGGVNRDADRKSAYVIRADGSVVSKRQGSSWHKDNFDNLRLYPGDTLVVPLNLNKGTGLRNVVDIAQIVGQFGIAIAAANVVF